MINTRITFIGCGNIGRSLIGGLIADGHKPDAITGVEPDEAKAAFIKKEYGIEVLADGSYAIKGSDVIILAVKPQVIVACLQNLAEQIRQNNPLIISVAAGVRIATLENILGEETAIVRTMPNTPALIGAGASCLFANESVSEAQKDNAEEIMRSVGLAIWLQREELMDIVTALSGSGPAYFFLTMEVMEKAAIKLGLARDQARLLTLETALGAARMALESELNTSDLREQVTSPGGTTEAALKVLMEQGHFEDLFLDALSAAKERSEEMALSFGDNK
jgi:pyrroline-5-carboxylate reductase